MFFIRIVVVLAAMTLFAGCRGEQGSDGDVPTITRDMSLYRALNLYNQADDAGRKKLLDALVERHVTVADLYDTVGWHKDKLDDRAHARLVAKYRVALLQETLAADHVSTLRQLVQHLLLNEGVPDLTRSIIALRFLQLAEHPCELDGMGAVAPDLPAGKYRAASERLADQVSKDPIDRYLRMLECIPEDLLGKYLNNARIHVLHEIDRCSSVHELTKLWLMVPKFMKSLVAEDFWNMGVYLSDDACGAQAAATLYLGHVPDGVGPDDTAYGIWMERTELALNLANNLGAVENITDVWRCAPPELKFEALEAIYARIKIEN